MALQKPPESSIVYEDARVYACLASFPMTRGHTIVAWKRPVRDLHLLTCRQVEYLMDVVDLVRDALLKTLGIEKVYLMYMDEAKHVHWHLVPRWNTQGFNAFRHRPRRVRLFPLAVALRAGIAASARAHPEVRSRR